MRDNHRNKKKERKEEGKKQHCLMEKRVYKKYYEWKGEAKPGKSNFVRNKPQNE